MYRQHGVAQEVVAPERLVFTFIWDETPDEEMLVTDTFGERGAKTQMTFRRTGLATAASQDGHERGWNEAFDQLGELLTAV